MYQVQAADMVAVRNRSHKSSAICEEVVVEVEVEVEIEVELELEGEVDGEGEGEV